MNELTNSVLLDYLIKLADELKSDMGRKSISANHFVISALCITRDMEEDSLPVDLDKVSVKQEINAINDILKNYNIDKFNAAKAMRNALGNTTESSLMDELLFTKIIKYTGASHAKQNGKSELSADIVLKLILDEPTVMVKKYIIEADYEMPERRKKTNRFIMPFDDETGEPGEERRKIAEIVDEKTGREKITDLVERVKNVHNVLISTVFGQDYAVNTFTSGYFQAELLSITNKKRIKPRATFLFAGPPGVGKTFLAEKAAEVLGLPFKRFDMSEYSDKEANLEFCGADKVYKNSKAGNVTGFVSEYPKSILLFDEIEKAHINVIHLFLQILDAGRLRDNYTDEEVPFTDTIIIFTTNAGRKIYKDSTYSNFSILPRKTILKALETEVNVTTGGPYFPAAICSRFASGNVVMFNSMEANSLSRIVKKEMLSCAANIESSIGIKTDIDERVYAALLFAEGGSADARAVKSRAETFFHGELFELFRLIASEKAKGIITELEKVCFSVQLPSGDEDIDGLFTGEGEPNVLVFGSESTLNLCREKGKGFKLFTTDDIEEAKEILYRNDIELVLCDLECGRRAECYNFLNVEDIDSCGRDFFWYIRTYVSSMPIYLVQTDNYRINQEEELSFAREGSRGVITVSKDHMDNFHETMGQICAALHQQKSMLNLSKANKVVNFETSQSISGDGKTANIILFDFELSLAVDARDSNNILSSISKPNIRFDQIIGAEDAKEELRYFVEYLKNPRKYLGKGVKAPKGVLLYGPPGTGKTMLAKAMASESDVTFITAVGNQLFKKYVGEGPEAVHNLFSIARKYAPSILFVDEIDAVAKERGKGQNQVSADEVLNAFLSEMDGFKTDPGKPVFVLAATNFSVEPGNPRSLDPALLRRFDRRIFVDLPDKQERERFLRLKIAANDAIEISDSKIKNIAVRSTGMSLAALESVIELALRTVVRTGDYKVTEDVFEEAFETFNSGEKKKWDERMIERIARHEAGHALVSWINGDTPSYITIVARSNHGGYMHQGDNEYKAIYTKEELLGRIETALAGRAAEVVYYGEKDGLSTGASGDLHTATNIARQIICTYGMDENFGLATVNTSQGQDDTISSEIRRHINRILNEEYGKTKKIIEENRNIIDSLVEELLEKNHISGEEITNLFNSLYV